MNVLPRSVVIRNLVATAAMVAASATNAQPMVDLRLAVSYADPADSASGGTFELAALSSGGFGIAAIVTRLTGIDLNLPASPVLTTPSVYNWIDMIDTEDGMVPPILDRGDGFTEILFGQELVLDGTGLVYDIGGGVGTPGAAGLDPFGLGFDDAALLATGSFSPGQTPAFSTDPELPTRANLFTTTQSPLDAFLEGADGVVAASAVSRSVVTNLTVTIAGDYDGNGSVGSEDYTLWSTNFGSTTQLDADGNGNSVVDVADYTIWRDNLPQPAAAVPEPTTTAIVLAALLIARRPNLRG